MVKNSLVGNINKRKKDVTSRSKKKSSVSHKAYKGIKAGWPKIRKNDCLKKTLWHTGSKAGASVSKECVVNTRT